MNSLIRQLSKIFDLTSEEMYEYYPTFKEHYHSYIQLRYLQKTLTLGIFIVGVVIVFILFGRHLSKKLHEDTIVISKLKFISLIALFIGLIVIRVMVSNAIALNPSPVDIPYILDILIT